MAMTSPSSQWSGSTSGIISQPVQTDEERLWRYLPLYKLTLDGNWKLAKPFFLGDPDAIRAKITAAGDTALHIAAGTGKAIHFLEELLKLGNVSDLHLLNGNGDTALSVAAMVGNTPAAKLFLMRDPQLALIVNKDGRLPITEAARFGHKKMVLLLLRFIEDGMMEPSGDKPGYSLLNLLIMAGFYDVVLVLAEHYKELVTTRFVDGDSLLNLIAQRPSAFPSGSRLSLRQRLIYAVVPVNLGNKLKSISSLLDGKHKNVDKLQPISLLHALLDKLQYLHNKLLHFGLSRLSLFYVTVILFLFGFNFMGDLLMHIIILFYVVWEVNRVVGDIIYIHGTKSTHKHALQIVKCLCSEIIDSRSPRDPSILEQALISAGRSGIHEIVEEIVGSFPDAVWFSDIENHNVLQLAVMNRHDKVFNLIYQLSAYKHLLTASHDTSGNNILHLAGKLAPSNQLNLVSGATLQVQRELQWFKEVEKFIHPTLKEDKNSEGKIPAVVFTEAHKDLIKEGEKWVKAAANSCTFVSALIATVGFAAAITVPGGNNQNDGFPVFFKKKAFRVFSISDGVSLISSIASVLMFLSILTSRYAEADFLVSLPRRLFVGLVTLFLSITSLTVAFGASIYLVFCHEDVDIIAPLIILAFLPVWMFGAGHFPLLVDIFLSSMGRIFRKQSARILY
ncbi:unnamed protein product [Ilex paraguariensis]|uniref:PGG domain-containing protein n=1 Tax=Ilex paraguariensis TaxID=185542 RepID=A0ABC8R130_9AQUA